MLERPKAYLRFFEPSHKAIDLSLRNGDTVVTKPSFQISLRHFGVLVDVDCIKKAPEVILLKLSANLFNLLLAFRQNFEKVLHADPGLSVKPFCAV